MLVDTHCHIQFQGYNNDRDAVILRCKEKGIILNLVGTQKDTSAAAVTLAEQHENMYASIATHPVHLHPTHVDEEESHFMTREEEFDEVHYEKLAQSPKVIAIGECGLDLYHLPKDKTIADVLEKQKQVFLDHANFAQKHDLPLCIHVRDGLTPETAKAHDLMIELLKDMKAPRGVIHCYTSNWRHAEQYLSLGFYLGFTGVVTFPAKKLDPKPQENLLEVLKKMPLDRILLETDSPYLAPQAFRGQRSEPWMVEEVVKTIAKIKGLSYDEVATATYENTLRLFDKIKR